jgi:hypothetical protein
MKTQTKEASLFWKESKQAIVAFDDLLSFEALQECNLVISWDVERQQC